MARFDHINTPNPAARAAGFRFGDKGTQTSRTMMLAELTELLEALPTTANREDYASAIIADNILGKQTTATRRLTNQRLGELYGLSLTVPLFRVYCPQFPAPIRYCVDRLPLTIPKFCLRVSDG